MNPRSHFTDEEIEAQTKHVPSTISNDPMSGASCPEKGPHRPEDGCHCPLCVTG